MKRFLLIIGIVSVLECLIVLFLYIWGLKQVSEEKFTQQPNADIVILDRHGRVISKFISEVKNGERDLTNIQRDDISMEDLLNSPLADAIVAVEDQRYYEHSGVDYRGIIRGMLGMPGTSTITMQLVKNIILGDQTKSISRKIREIGLALALERRFSKEMILLLYANNIFLGEDEGGAIYGVGAASRKLFGKDLQQLTLEEASLLAGMIHKPSIYMRRIREGKLNPVRERRDLVLMLMNKRFPNKYNKQTTQSAMQTPVVFHIKSTQNENQIIRYFTDHVRYEMKQILSDGIISSGRFAVYTSLDLEMQVFAELAVLQGLDQIKLPHIQQEEGVKPLQAALISIDPKDGGIRALVGGREYQNSQFNRATKAKRQAGSIFKPFVFLTGFEQAVKGERPFTPLTQINDVPVALNESGRWPKNDDGKYSGQVSLRTILVESRNAGTVRFSQEVGIEAIAQTARALGVNGRMEMVPSLALGSLEVTPLEIAASYSALANGGLRINPFSIEKIVSAEGKEFYTRIDSSPLRVVSPQAAFLTTFILEGVVNEGTGEYVRRLGFKRPVAGKTGTTNNGKDAWFAAYVPDLVTVVWVGRDDETPNHLSGAGAAVPLWVDFMKKAISNMPYKDFHIPPGIVLRRVDRNGLICPGGKEEAFIAGTEPKGFCNKTFSTRAFEKISG